MNSPIPVAPKDSTLTPTPHIVAVVVGAVGGFLSTKVGLPAEYVSLISIGLTATLTTGIHFLLAKIAL